MSKQYFDAAPDCESRPVVLTVPADGGTLTFETDAGVFSKGELDEGTKLLLENAGMLQGRVLDLGCGWGAIGITVAKRFPETEVWMCDVNERAVALARKNILQNQACNARAVLSDGFSAVEGSFDTILTNPPIRAGKSVIYGFFRDAAQRLTPNGSLILVIRKQQGAESAERYLKTIYENVLRLDRKKGFWILQCSYPIKTTN